MENRAKQNFIDASFEAWSRRDPKPLIGFATAEVDNLTPKEIASILSLAVHIHRDTLDVSTLNIKGNAITEMIERILTPPSLLGF